jgi:hypothetical protein
MPIDNLTKWGDLNVWGNLVSWFQIGPYSRDIADSEGHTLTLAEAIAISVRQTFGDSSTLSLEEAISIGFIIPLSDSTTISLVETVTIANHRAIADTLGISLVEALSIEVSGVVFKELSDIMGLAIQEDIVAQIPASAGTPIRFAISSEPITRFRLSTQRDPDNNP